MNASGGVPAPGSPRPESHPTKRPAFEPAERLLRPTGYDPDMPRPITTVAGAVLVLLRVLSGILILVALTVGWDSFAADLEVGTDGADMSSDVSRLALTVVLVGGTAVLIVDALLGLLTFRGLNWARVVVMLISVFSISTTFTAWWVQGQEITLDGTFVSLSLDILILLALSSRSAAAYARRKERPA